MAVGCAVLALLVMSGSAAAGSGLAAKPITVSPIKAVILVDESGSQTAKSVQDEKNAASLLALSELSSSSQFAVDGFGSSNGPGQTAVNVYCGFTTVGNSVAREHVAACAQRLHRRTAQEGYDTDFAAALREAVAQLSGTPRGQTPIIFLLTDGVLDVSHSPSYGTNPAQRDAVAERQIRQQILPAARRAGIQIWTLGFGPQVNKGALDAFARGGAGANSHCAGVAGAKPSGVVVGNSTQVVIGLLRTLGRARCAEVEPPSSGLLQPGKTLTLKVQIPVVATDGAITVTKSDPTFAVSFFDPKGEQAPANGTLSGQAFELSGASSPVEALRVQEPIPGTWTVKVTDPARHRGQQVTATAVWEGVLRASVTLAPASPQPGHPTTVEVQLLTRSGFVSGAALQGIQASAVASGSFGNLDVPLHDDGKAPDVKAHDGTFSGTLTIPGGAAGNVEVIGRVSGAGLASDQQPYYFAIASPGQPVAEVELAVPDAVHPGTTLHGTVNIQNQGAAQKGTLALTDISNGAQLSISPSVLTIPTGSGRVGFSLNFASSTPTTPATARIEVLNAKRQPIGEDPIATQVTTPPGFVSRFWWILPLVVVAALAVLVYLRWRAGAARKRDAVRDLSAHLYRNGSKVSWLDAPSSGSVFPIEVIDDDGAPRIRAGSDGQATVTIRRSGLGFVVEGPAHEASVEEFGKPVEINDRLSLVVVDKRLTGIPIVEQTARESIGDGMVAQASAPAETDDLL